MREQENLLSFVRALSEMTGDQIANYDVEGAAALLSTLTQLHDEIGEAIVRLAPVSCSYSEHDDLQIH